LHASLPARFTVEDMEGLVDRETGVTGGTAPLKDPNVKLITVPTSLSASEWNSISSATNLSGKKQHFGSFTGNTAPNLILLDPEVASTAPEQLWLSSGLRAVDHCVETMCNAQCTEEASSHVQEGLKLLLHGLRDYKEGRAEQQKDELLSGINECQQGSREAMLGIVIWHIPMGPSHAIGHQLGE
jgi:alcohol dehydrogenase class IV